MMVVQFSRIKEYLDIVGGGAGSASHGKFWQGDYASFTNGFVLNQKCKGLKIPIIDKIDPQNSGFLQILKALPGFCTKPRMPLGGPYLDAGYSITLSDGKAVSGPQIIQDIEDWLKAGYPENADSMNPSV
jgi:hypothetical protein